MAAVQENEFFRSPPFLGKFFAITGMLLITMMSIAPHLVPYDYMGPVGLLSRFLVENASILVHFLTVTAWALHVGEAIYAGKLCRDKNIRDEDRSKWVIQTFLYGILSLRYLLKYDPEKKVD